MYNKVILIGNLVKDPEMKLFKGSNLAKFRLAVDDAFKKDAVLYIDVEAWDKQAEFAEKWLKKGKGVIVDGRLCMDSWEKDGKKETKIFVKASDIRFSNVGTGSPQTNKETDNTSSEKPKSKQEPTKSNQKMEIEDFEDVPF